MNGRYNEVMSIKQTKRCQIRKISSIQVPFVSSFSLLLLSPDRADTPVQHFELAECGFDR